MQDYWDSIDQFGKSSDAISVKLEAEASKLKIMQL